jgi:probable phosphoglycerate mutase
VLGLPAGRWVCHPGYTAIHRIAASRQGHRNVVTMNETAHLRGSGLIISPGRVG